MIELPALRKLRAHVRVSGQLLTLQVPAWHWAWRGLVLALAVPPLVVLLAVLVALAAAKPGGAAEPSPILAGAAAMTFFAGLGLALVSPLLARRTRTVLDLERRVVVTLQTSVPFDALSGVHVVPAVASSSLFVLSASRRGGQPDVRLLGPLSERQLPDARLLASWLDGVIKGAERAAG